MKTILLGRTLVGVAGVCVSVASLVGLFSRNVDDSKFEPGFAKDFCRGLNIVNIFGALYNLRSILSGDVFK